MNEFVQYTKEMDESHNRIMAYALRKAADHAKSCDWMSETDKVRAEIEAQIYEMRMPR